MKDEGKRKSALFLPSNRLNKGDLSIPILTAVLAFLGVVFVFSASYYNAQIQYGDAFYFAKKQGIGFLIGLASMVGVSFLDYKKLRSIKVAIVFVAVAFVLLGAVFIPGLGKTSYGATRWIAIGGITIQPSEIAKYALVLFIASYACKDMGRMRTFIGVLPVLAVGGGFCVLILIEPNMSVATCVGILLVAMLFLSGMRWKHFLWIALPLLVAVPVFILIEPYRLLRLSAFLDPWASPKDEGYQLIQSLYALGNGGWFGTGLFRSRQKYRFLPFAESDFVLAIIGEEVGFVGVVVLFCICGFLVWRGIKTAVLATDFFTFLFAVGITLVYAVQTVLNALVVSGAIPPTGLPLPLISSGNTSLIITMTSMGFLYGITRQRGAVRAVGVR